MSDRDESAARRRAALAAFPQRQTSHIADEGFRHSTDFGMLGRKSRQGATVALNDELIVLRFHLGKTAQLIERCDRVLKPGSNWAIRGGIATGQMTANRTQRQLKLVWRQMILKLDQHPIKHVGVRPREEALGLRSESVEKGWFPAPPTPAEADLAYEPIAFECRKVGTDSVISQP
jgi:hypothetical protein